MVWIESHQDLARHPKTRKAAAMLDVSQPTMIGHLHMLWWWAMDYAPDGDLTDFDDFDVALGAGWDGDASEFVQALTNCGPGDLAGFIEQTSGRMVLHDWDDYGGKLHKRREADAARKRAARAAKSDTQDDQTPSSGRPTDGAKTSNGTAHVEDRTGQDKTDRTDLTTSDSTSDDNWAVEATDVDTVKETAWAVAQMIADNGHPLPSKGSSKADGWFRDMDLLLRHGPAGESTVDPPTPDDVVEVARWATEDSFWRQNIQSIGSLRKHWSRLALAARDGPKNGTPTGLEAVVAASRRAG